MSAHDDPPQSSAVPVDRAGRRPKAVVTRRPALERAGNDESFPAPLGFEVLLREINTVVELLERIDVALDAQATPVDEAA